jgi:hypothetical protein
MPAQQGIDLALQRFNKPGWLPDLKVWYKSNNLIITNSGKDGVESWLLLLD